MLSILLVSSYLHAATTVTLATMDTDHIKPGMKGYGLSVFKGIEPVRFEIEVIGVMKNTAPKHDFIIVKGTDEFLKLKGISAGMSGSPVYVEEKLIGALSRAFPQAKEPYALVTPIKNMLEESYRVREHAASIPFHQPSVVEKARDRAALSGLWPPPEQDITVPILTPLAGSGWTSRSFRYLKEVFEPLGFMVIEGGAAGGPDRANPVPKPHPSQPFKPGDAIHVCLIKGDWSLGGTGTVTAVEGDLVLAFGHPMIGSGESALPISTAQIFDVMPSYGTSFKLASAGEEVGMLIQDRLPCIVGTTAKRATMLPVTITIKNTATALARSFSLEIANDEVLTPSLIVMAMTNVLDQVENTTASGSVVRYTFTLGVKGRDPIVIRDTFMNDPMPPASAALSGVPESMHMILQLFSVLNNPFKKLEPVTINAEFQVIHEKHRAPIDLVWLSATDVKAGTPLDIHVNLKPYHQDTAQEVLTLDIPPHLPEGEYELQVSGGREAMADTLTPETLEDILAMNKARLTSDTLVVKLILPSVGLSTKGVKLPSIPGSYVGALVGNGSSSIGVERDSLMISKPSKWLITGKKRLTLKISQSRGGER